MITRNYKYKNELMLMQKVFKDAYKVCILNQHKDVKIKKDKTYVTNVDINTEKHIISRIKEQFPNDNFLTEETNSKTKLGKRTWVIDPIDGTTFFIRDSYFYSIQGVFYDENNVQFSVIYQPKLNATYVAIKGQGAYLNNKRLHRNCDVKMDTTIYAINNNYARWTNEIHEIFMKLYEYGKTNICAPKDFKIDSSGVAYSLLANGTIDFFIEPADTKWDYMPGDLLVKEAGANYYNFDNEKYVRIYSYSPELDKFLGLIK